MESPSVDAILQANATTDAAWLGLYGQIVIAVFTVALSGLGAFIVARYGAKIGAQATMDAALAAQQRAEEAAEKAQMRAIEVQRKEWLRLQQEQDKSIVASLLNELTLISAQAGPSGKRLHQGYSWITLPTLSTEFSLHNLRVTTVSQDVIEALNQTRTAIAAYNSQAFYSNTRERRGTGFSDQELYGLAQAVVDRCEELYSIVQRDFKDTGLQPKLTASVEETSLTT